jgi:hypothetical protein
MNFLEAIAAEERECPADTFDREAALRLSDVFCSVSLREVMTNRRAGLAAFWWRPVDGAILPLAAQVANLNGDLSEAIAMEQAQGRSVERMLDGLVPLNTPAEAQLAEAYAALGTFRDDIRERKAA